ncbi:hypothetical protein AOLI_G00029440 [Acnodon oligacanthus]
MNIFPTQRRRRLARLACNQILCVSGSWRDGANAYPEAQPPLGRAAQLSLHVWQQAAFHNGPGITIINLENLCLGCYAREQPLGKSTVNAKLPAPLNRSAFSRPSACLRDRRPQRPHRFLRTRAVSRIRTAPSLTPTRHSLGRSLLKGCRARRRRADNFRLKLQVKSTRGSNNVRPYPLRERTSLPSQRTARARELGTVL